ncbi:MAG: glutamate racemase [Planctomycetaceae bacterium]
MPFALFSNKRWLLSLGLGLLGASYLSADTPSSPSAVADLIEHVQQNPDGRAPFSFDASTYRDDTKELPIGVFDSGIGGLTVLEAILALDAFHNDNLRPGPDGRRDFENESFVYFGDQANMPYGNYAAAGKEDYLKELIVKDSVFLLGRRYWETADAKQPRFDKPPVKAIVIACNTATAYGLDDVRAAVDAWKIPVIIVGVVEAGARGVAESISATEPPRTVAVLATVGTCASMAYPKAIGRAVGIAGKRSPHVIQQGSFALAGAIEGDPAFVSRSVRDYVSDDVAQLMEGYRRSGGTEPVTTVVLGCTHFSLVKDDIVSAFARLRDLQWQGDDEKPFQSLVAEEIQIIDPAELTAKELFRSLALAGLRRGGHSAADSAKGAFFISVPSAQGPGALETDGSFRNTYKYARQTRQFSVEDTRVVPLSPSMLPETSRRMIQTRLPSVWQRLK